ncbi:unnamed protein product [Owenia fusiformis]|uniref:Uncharacterized protein n=1 Tax=Owenia fusiformis TaxID=6347 RepID=A0A8J1TVF0_OWEFU|nr:unnamed protein product [Owenia fusiformis]
MAKYIEVQKIKKSIRKIREIFGDDCDFVKSFDLLVDSYSEDSKISEQGGQISNTAFNRRIDTLHKILATVQEIPEVLQVPIKCPLFITGNMRTGSTFLHHLLSLDSAFLSPPVWQFENPSPFPVDFKEERMKDFQPIADLWNSRPGFTAVHPAFTPLSIEECFWIFFRTGVWRDANTSMLNSDSYIDWYENMTQQEELRIIRHYKKELQIIAFKQGNDDMSYIRKDSYHLRFLPTLLEVFPDARIVHLVRDAAANLASICSISYIVATLIYDEKDIDRVKIGKLAMRYSKFGMRKFLEYRKIYDAQLKPGERSVFYDVKYESLLADPVETMSKIYSHFEMDLIDETKEKVGVYLDDCSKNWKATYPHSLENFGITQNDVDEMYHDYMKYFG